MERATGDYMGMLATVDALAMQSALEQKDVPVRYVCSAYQRGV